MKRRNARADFRTPVAAGPVAWLRAERDGVTILIHLQPGARRSGIAGEHGGRLKIAVQAPPVDGRANAALIGWVADRLGVPQQMVSLIAGHQGRDKTIRASGVDVDRARQVLSPE